MHFDEELRILREENRKLKEQLTGRQDLLIADFIPLLISYVDCDLRYVFVNKAYEKWFKVSKEEIRGKYVRELVGDAVFSKALPYFRRAIEGEALEFEQEAKYAEGTRFIHVHYIPDKSSDGRVQGIITLVADITDRKRLEFAQQEELNRLTTLLEEAPVSIALLTGPKHRFYAANKNYRKDFLPKDAIGKTLEEVIPEIKGQGFVELLDEVYKTGRPYIGKEVPYSYAGRKFFLNFVYQAVRNASDEVTGILAVITDVTDEVKIKDELLEQREIRERFVSTLTHDLTTPVTAARMSAQLILRKLGDENAVSSLAYRILNNLSRSETMVRDLLDANLINVGESLPISRKKMDLNTVIDETLLDLMLLHEGRFRFVKEDHPIEGMWDPSAIRRVMENLLNNAVKYSAPDTPITVTTSLRNNTAGVDVNNLGIMISPEEQLKLFDRYRRLDSAIDSGKKGWGIGLSLVKGLVEAHKGRVSVESDNSQGTTFKVRLPRY